MGSNILSMQIFKFRPGRFYILWHLPFNVKPPLNSVFQSCCISRGFQFLVQMPENVVARLRGRFQYLNQNLGVLGVESEERAINKALEC